MPALLAGPFPMQRFHLRERIHRPPEDVWAFMTRPERALRWIPGTTELGWDAATRPGPGGRFHIARTRGDPATHADLVVVIWQPPERFAATMPARGGLLRHTYTLRAVPEGTDVEYEVRAEPENLAGRMLLGIAVRRLYETDAPLLARLRAAVEAEPPRRGTASPLLAGGR